MLDGIRLVGSYDSHGELMGGYAMRACVPCRAGMPCVRAVSLLPSQCRHTRLAAATS